MIGDCCKSDLRRTSMLWVFFCIALIAGTTRVAWADNPPGGGSRLPGISFALVHDGDVLIPKGVSDAGNAGANGVREACDRWRPLWLIGVDRPFYCVAASSEGHDTIDLSLLNVPSSSNSMVARLISTSRLHAQPVAEMDGLQSDSIRQVLPQPYRSVRHFGMVKVVGRTYYFFPGENARDNIGCDLIKVAVLSQEAGKVTLLGTLDGMPRMLIDQPGDGLPLAWVEAGCPIGPSVSLVRLDKGLDAPVDFMNGYEYDEPDTNVPEPNPFSIDCRKASTTPETTICARPDLLIYDRDVADNYRALRNKLRGHDLDELQTGQKNWVIERNACRNPATSSLYIDGEYGCLRSRLIRRHESLLTQIAKP